MPDPRVDDKKGKKAMVYKARKDRRMGDRGKTEEWGTEKKQKEKENQISKACPKRFIATFHARILNLFTLKSIILAQDQTSSLSCTL